MSFDLAAHPLLSLTGDVLTVPVSLESAGNSLSSDAVAQAGAAARAVLDGELAPRVIKLVGLGKNFCAGGNVPGFAAAPDRSEHVDEVATLLHDFLADLDRVEIPVVAVVSGWAAGAGMSLVLAADIAVGGPGTRLVPAYTGIGLSPDGGMSWRLPRVVGRARATRMILLNEALDGHRAAELGILSECVDSDEPGAVAERADAICAQLAAGPAESYGRVKRLLRESESATLTEQLDAERESISHLASAPCGVEGVDAFVEKRQPQF